MDRRGFFGTIAGALVATFVTLDPERALWVPGKKLISIPAPRFDPRFLVQVKAGNPFYAIPEGRLRGINEKLPRYEIPLQLMSVGDWLRVPQVRGALRSAAVVPLYHRGDADWQSTIALVPIPDRDTVLAVEYVPATMSCRVNDSPALAVALPIPRRAQVWAAR